MRAVRAPQCALVIPLLRICFGTWSNVDFPLGENSSGWRAQTPADSTRPAKTFIVTPRFNSAGHFPFSGAFINHNINFDVIRFLKAGLPVKVLIEGLIGVISAGIA